MKKQYTKPVVSDVTLDTTMLWGSQPGPKTYYLTFDSGHISVKAGDIVYVDNIKHVCNTDGICWIDRDAQGKETLTIDPINLW